MSQKFLTDSDLAARYSISRATVWRWANAGRLPAPVRLGEATTRWCLDDVLKYEQRLERQRSPSAA
jgi:predicted DNA-binding transcriptional regulator AlpA